MNQLIEFWSDIRNVENASAEDMQKDILAYLRRLAGAQKTISDLNESKRLLHAIHDEQCARSSEYFNENIRLRKALEEAKDDLIEIIGVQDSSLDVEDLSQKAIKSINSVLGKR